MERSKMKNIKVRAFRTIVPVVLAAVALAAQTSNEAKSAQKAAPVKTRSTTKASPAMTREQGDAILDELRQIRQLLEKQQTLNLLPQRPMASPQARLTMEIPADAYSLGRTDAPVTIVEFADYQCPYCRRFHSQTYAEFKKNYIDTGKVRFISRDLPLDFHPNALPAAEAARCAGQQGKFWEMHDALLSNDASELNKEGIDQRAQAVALDMTKFHGCVEAAPFKGAILKDVSFAGALGISGTPTFVVGKSANGKLNGLRLVGALPYDRLQAAVEDLLKHPVAD